MYDDFLSPMPRVVAHRGDSINFPENTLEAFISGVDMGIDVIDLNLIKVWERKVVVKKSETIINSITD